MTDAQWSTALQMVRVKKNTWISHPRQGNYAPCSILCLSRSANSTIELKSKIRQDVRDKPCARLGLATSSWGHLGCHKRVPTGTILRAGDHLRFIWSETGGIHRSCMATKQSWLTGCLVIHQTFQHIICNKSGNIRKKPAWNERGRLS